MTSWTAALHKKARACSTQPCPPSFLDQNCLPYGNLCAPVHVPAAMCESLPNGGWEVSWLACWLSDEAIFSNVAFISTKGGVSAMFAPLFYFIIFPEPTQGRGMLCVGCPNRERTARPWRSWNAPP